MKQARLETGVKTVYTVSRLSARIRERLTGDSELQDIIVQGEVGECTLSSAGHLYFTMKENEVQIGCVTFSARKRLSFIPKSGDMIRVRGSVSTYEPRGTYQLRVETIERVGRGELWEEFLRLKEKLRDEGLFEKAQKKEIPEFPETVGVVTSGSGAAFHDIRQITSRRFPVKILLYPASVQGEGAADEIAEGIRHLDGRVDVMIVGRGGGSMEDLWAFNEEKVARAIFEAETPIISAVGHETDFTISDMVADVRAATPSEAAELVVPDREKLFDLLDNLWLRSSLSMSSRVEEASQRLDSAEERMKRGMAGLMEAKTERLKHLSKLLEKSDPMAPLRRGFSMVRKDGEWIKSAIELEAGLEVSIVMADGEANARIKEVRKNRRNDDEQI